MFLNPEIKTKDENEKILKKKILEQMEFYFSDSNLAKDRFLKKEIQNSQDGFIMLNLFLRFNKIRTLTDDLKKIKKSLKKSQVLELNDEKTMVRRREMFSEPSQKDTDKRTVYVENLPANIANEKLSRLFKTFGEIAYISLPKFKASFQSKGFAFIEFKEKDSAKKVIQYFENNDKVEGKFPKSNPKIVQLEKQINRIKELIKARNEDEITNDEANTSKIPNKRKLSDSVDMEENESKEKRKKELTDDELMKTLNVISKKGWIKLREDFLNKQKQEIDNLKSELALLEEKLKQKITEKHESKNLNIKTNDITKGCIIRLTLNSCNEKDYEVFKLSRQQFKVKYIQEEFASHVAYVDIQKSSNKIYIRCNSNESALLLLNSDSFLKEFKKSFLEGLEEVEYFERIFSNRHKKLEKKERKNHINLNEKCDLSLDSKKKDSGKQISFSQENVDKKESKPKHYTFDDDI